MFSFNFVISIVLSFITVFSIAAERDPAEVSPKSITLGLVPSEDRALLEKNGKELAKELEKKLNVKVSILVPKDYNGLIHAMKNKKVDYAFFTAASFVQAEKESGAKVLLKKVWSGPFYYSVLLAKKSSGIKKIVDLKAKRVAFVDEKSTSGHLYPLLQMKKQSIDPSKDFKSIKFTGNHQASAKALLADEVDAIAVYADSEDGHKNAVTAVDASKQNELEIIWKSGPIPNDPFAVRQDFYDLYPQFTHSLMFAFIDLKEDSRGNLLKKWLGVTEVMMATSRQYDPVRELVRELDLKH